MPHMLTAAVQLEEKVRFIGQAGAGQPVVIDYPPPLGDGQGIMSLELLLMGLASCSASTVVTFLRKMQQPVKGLQVQASGTRRDEHPTVLTEIELRFIISGTGVSPDAVARAIALSEDKYCPVWAMLKPGTRITSSFEIVAEEPTPAI